MSALYWVSNMTMQGKYKVVTECPRWLNWTFRLGRRTEVMAVLLLSVTTSTANFLIRLLSAKLSEKVQAWRNLYGDGVHVMLLFQVLGRADRSAWKWWLCPQPFPRDIPGGWVATDFCWRCWLTSAWSSCCWHTFCSLLPKPVWPDHQWLHAVNYRLL